MPSTILDADQLAKANELLAGIRADLRKLAGDDPDLLFAYNRKIAKMLQYDERTGPNERRKLKRLKMEAQGGLCAICGEPLPATYNVLDRITQTGGYTADNTRLIHEACDRKVQKERAYKAA